LLQSPGEDVAKSWLSQAFAVQLGGAELANSAAPPLRGVLIAGVVIALVAGLLSMRRCIVSNRTAAARRSRPRRKSDDIATIHLRKPDALHTIEPAVDAKAK